MLRARSLEEAQAVVQCSFGNYLARERGQERASTAEVLENSLAALQTELVEAGGTHHAPAGVNAKQWAACLKLEER